MNVKIGPYVNWIGPYQIAEKLLFWMDKQDDRVHNFGTWLAQDKNGNDTALTKICNWIHSKKERKVKVKLDRYDTWNMDGTLAIIILPMLKQLKATKHGAPYVDNKDVPRKLRSKTKDVFGTDETHFQRWDWVMDELIWTFEQLQPDCDWEAQYHSGEYDIVWKQCEDSELYEMTTGPKNTHVWDKDGHMKHQERINNGLRLFGKYYQGLWD